MATHTGCFFFILACLTCSYFGQFLTKNHFFDIFHIYISFIFCKKNLVKKFLKTENFIQVFVKVPIFKIFEKILFFHFLIKNFIIFTNLRIKLNLFWYFLYCLLCLLLKNAILTKNLVENVKLWPFCCNFFRKRDYF